MWMAIEIVDIGCVLTLYRGLDKSIQRLIAERYDLSVPYGALESWIKTLTVIRNLCAHHGRVWNRDFGLTPEIPKKNPVWVSTEIPDRKKLYSILCIIKYLINYIAPQSKWHYRLYKLLDKHNEIPMKNMGFPDNWKESPIWQNDTLINN